MRHHLQMTPSAYIFSRPVHPLRQWPRHPGRRRPRPAARPLAEHQRRLRPQPRARAARRPGGQRGRDLRAEQGLELPFAEDILERFAAAMIGKWNTILGPLPQ